MDKDSDDQCHHSHIHCASNLPSRLCIKSYHRTAIEAPTKTLQSHRIRKYKNKNEHRKQRNQHHIQEPKEPNPKPPHIQEANKKGNRNAPNHRTAICNHTIQLKHKTEHHTIQTIDGAHHKR
eukprot:54029_1